MQVASPRRKILVLAVALAVLSAGTVATILYLGKAGREAAPAADSSSSSASATVVQASAKGQAADTGGPEKDGKGKTAVPVSVSPCASGSVSSYITSTANLVPENDVLILAEREGKVAEIMAEEGDAVGKGRTLALLVQDDQAIAYRKARIQADNSRANHERALSMRAENLISEEEFERIATEKAVAEQEEEEARWNLEKTTIRAPFAGQVTERMITPGRHVQIGEELFRVADFTPLIARVYLPEKDVFSLDVGREVRLTSKASEDIQFKGRIRQISPVVDTETGTVKVTIEVSSPPPQVRPGAFVSIDIVRETHPEVVVVQRQSVIRELQHAYVFVAEGDKAERRTVSLGLEEGDRVEIISGVEVGEQVVIAGQGGLKDGSPIRIIPPSGASARAGESDHAPRT